MQVSDHNDRGRILYIYRRPGLPVTQHKEKQSTNVNKFNKVMQQIIKIVIFRMINSSDLISQFTPIIVH